MRYLTLPALVSAACLALACSSNPAGSVSEEIDLPRPGDTDVPELAEVHIQPTDALPDLPAEVEARIDTNELPQPACSPGEGCFLDECTENKQCLSGWCVGHMGGGVCSMACQDECPAGWSCQQVAGTEPDVVFICVSSYSKLCSPCQGSADCQNVAGQDFLCLDYGPEGSFCGGPCEAGGSTCPAGFSCKDAITVDGIEIPQCVADSGACPCTPYAVALKLWTPCAAASEFGTCQGKRVCEEGGLTPCDAPEPSAESCDGQDNDCDGAVDEGTCDDGNPCTADACAGAEGCQSTPLDSGECLDGDICTVADHCQKGQCVGTPLSCDDGNPCTDDSCDGVGGCDFQPNTDACDDSNACTAGDNCQAGACVPGPPAVCDDDNVCTDDSCDPATGCLNVANALPCGGCLQCSLGDCLPVDGGADPFLNCAGTSPACAGKCDGSGSCAFPDNQTTCAPPECIGTALSLSLCDKSGGCALVVSDCAPYACNAEGNACQADCSGDTDCAPGLVCRNGLCEPNTFPTVDAVQLGPEVLLTDTIAVCSASGTLDTEGDPVQLDYQWSVNGQQVPGAGGASLDGSHFSKGDELACAVQATDPWGPGPWAWSSSKVVDNTPPTQPEVAVEPKSPMDEDDLACVLLTPSEDADNDMLTYHFSWTRNGMPIPEFDGANLVSGTVTKPCDVWQCAAQPDDGEDKGPAGTGSTALTPLPEVCDGKDNNCDGHVDESCVQTALVGMVSSGLQGEVGGYLMSTTMGTALLGAASGPAGTVQLGTLPAAGTK